MPELPEVQTIVDDLNKKVKGDIIVDFWSDWPKTIKGMSLKKFEAEIKDRKILKAWRIGKNMFIDLSGGPACNASHSDAGRKTLYIHLKMTGHLLIKCKSQNARCKMTKQSSKSDQYDYFTDRVNQYIHHIWYLKSEKTLEFSDLRKFAKIVLVDTGKVRELSEIKKLGVDAMSKEFTLEKFEEILFKKQNQKIGLVLMDQELIAGIGNIYRSEILFNATIHPKRLVRNLKDVEIKNIYNSIKKILKKAIEMRGTSDSDYRDTSGAPGSFHKILKVYRKDGEMCSCVRKKKKCDTIIRRMTLGQRSVFFCPKCQK